MADFGLKKFLRDHWSNRYSARLGRIERKVAEIEYRSHGARATFVGNNRVLVKTVTGGHNIAYFVEADDLLISPWFIITGKYETILTDFFLQTVQRDSHCLDVGANFGFFSCLFARLAPDGRVFSVEADDHIHRLCRDNLAINGFNIIGTAIHAAANADGEPITLYRRSGRSGNTSIIAMDRSFTDLLGEPPAQPFEVGGLRLDSLLPQFDGRVDILKIDVEGAEPLALRGAQEIIATNTQLKIVMEWSPGQIRGAGFDVAAFLDELAGQGLRFFDMRAGSPALISADDLMAIDYMAGVLLQR